jgi:hypothetical protein
MNIFEPAHSSSNVGVTTGVSSDEWSALQTSHANVLLIGEDQQVAEAVSVLQAIVRQPVVWCRASALTLTPDFGGSVVLRDAETLNLTEQQQLLDWLSETHRPRQVITTSSTSLFAAVERAAFSDALYYRLNMLTFVLGPGTLPPADVRQ